MPATHAEDPAPYDPRRGSDQYGTATRPPDSGGSSATLWLLPPWLHRGSAVDARGRNLRVAARCRWIGSLDRGSARCGDRRMVLTSRSINLPQCVCVCHGCARSTSPGALRPPPSAVSLFDRHVTFDRLIVPSLISTHPSEFHDVPITFRRDCHSVGRIKTVATRRERDRQGRGEKKGGTISLR